MCAKQHARLFSSKCAWALTSQFLRYNSSETRGWVRRFDVFFDLRLIKRLSKQSWDWWFETLSCPSWRHCNASTRDKINFTIPIRCTCISILWINTNGLLGIIHRIKNQGICNKSFGFQFVGFHEKGIFHYQFSWFNIPFKKPILYKKLAVK